MYFSRFAFYDRSGHAGRKYDGVVCTCTNFLTARVIAVGLLIVTSCVTASAHSYVVLEHILNTCTVRRIPEELVSKRAHLEAMKDFSSCTELFMLPKSGQMNRG